MNRVLGGTLTNEQTRLMSQMREDTERLIIASQIVVIGLAIYVERKPGQVAKLRNQFPKRVAIADHDRLVVGKAIVAEFSSWVSTRDIVSIVSPR